MNRISLKQLTGRRDGWQTITYACRGVKKEGRDKAFIATSEVFGGAIRVVRLEHGRSNGAADTCSDLEMTADLHTPTVGVRLPAKCCAKQF